MSWHCHRPARLRGLLFLVVLAGCASRSPSTSSSSSSGASSGAASCRRQIDCGGGFVCNIPDGGGEGFCSRYTCTADSGCVPGLVCNPLTNFCILPACNPHEPAPCGDGGVCYNVSSWEGGPATYQVGCRDAAPTVPPLSRCLFDRDRWVARPEARHRAFAFAADPVPQPYAVFAFTSEDPGVVRVDGDALVAVAPGSTTITATPLSGGGSCQLPVTVLDAVSGWDVRVMVEDATTHAPVPQAHVQLRNATGPVEVKDTDASGAVVFSGVTRAEDVMDVSVFAPSSAAWPAGHDYLTYVQPNTRDLLFALPRTREYAAALVHPVQSRTMMPPAADVKFEVSGLSWHHPLQDISLATLEGPPRLVDIYIPALNIAQSNVPAPSQTELRLQNSDLYGLGLPHDSVNCDPVSCRYVAWGLGTQISLSKAVPLLYALGPKAPGDLLWGLVPWLRNGHHGVDWQPALTHAALDMGVPSFLGQPVPLSDTMPTMFPVAWKIPTLPTAPSGAPLAQVLLLTGVEVPSFGFVPLGIEAQTDVCIPTTSVSCPLSPEEDGVISCSQPAYPPTGRCNDHAPGAVVVDQVPAHDGLERFPLLTMVIASRPVDEALHGRTLSMLLSRNAALAGARTVTNTFPAGDWLPIPALTVNRALGTLDIVDTPGAHYQRVILSASAPGTSGQRQWQLILPPMSPHAVVEIPPVPPGLPGVPAASVVFQAVRLEHGASHPANVQQMMEPCGFGFDEEAGHVVALSQVR